MRNNLGNLELNSVSDLLKIMNRKLYSRTARWIYRGQSNEDWSLVPSIGRLYKSTNFKSKEKLEKFEKSAFAEFFIRNYSDFREGNKITNLAIAQHHGLKTRMLDWTFSPLIGLFFAVENESCYKKNGSLFAHENVDGYNKFESKEFDIFIENTYNKEYYFVRSPPLTPRIKAQSSLLQIFKSPAEKLEMGESFIKISIPAKSKKKIKMELFDLGISYDTIFPDSDGIAKSINYYKLKEE